MPKMIDVNLPNKKTLDLTFENPTVFDAYRLRFQTLPNGKECCIYAGAD